jgi:hypothetical protein
MVANIALDFALGLIPVAGDLADMVFKSYVRNLRIIEDHIREAERVVEAQVLRR